MVEVMKIGEVTKEEMELAIEAINNKRLDEQYIENRNLALKAYSDFLIYCKELGVEPRLVGGYVYKYSKLEDEQVYFPLTRNSIL
jgi:thiaminase